MVESLLHRHEELSLDPQRTSRRPALVVHTCDHMGLGGKDRILEACWLDSLAQSESSTFSVSLSEKPKSNCKGHLTPSPGPASTYADIKHTHT